MAKLIAKVRVVVGVERDGKIERIEFAPGDEVHGLNAHDARELTAAGAVRDLDVERAAAQARASAEAKSAAEFEAARAAVREAHASTAPAAAAAAELGETAHGGAKASDGLTVAQLREALDAKGVAIPEGVTLKADLAALLDGAV